MTTPPRPPTATQPGACRAGTEHAVRADLGAAGLPEGATWLVDWRDAVFIHFALPPEQLRPYLRHAPAVHHDSAWLTVAIYRQLRHRGPSPELAPWGDRLCCQVRVPVIGEDDDDFELLAGWCQIGRASCRER